MNSIILTQEEIEAENLRMRLEDDTLFLLKKFPKRIKRKYLIERIRNDFIPPSNTSKKILENRNLKNIPEEITIESGIAIRRSTLRYLPTHNDYYISDIINENIATEIGYATPLLILHYSLDRQWCYIQTHFYRGWFLKEDILLLSEEERLHFEEPKKFIIITKPCIPFRNYLLDLGTKLPLLAIHDTYYEILIPTKEGITIDKISKSIANIGYVPYTPIHILQLAKNYIGIPYQWGGTNQGIDCSLLIYTLFHAFGFVFPRDTDHQEKVIGKKKIDLKGKTEEEKKIVLNAITYPAILHKKGHILLAISPTQVIHAYGDAKKVILSSLDSCYGTNLYPFLTTISCLSR